MGIGFILGPVIGGLLVATFATLMFVPCVFALLHQKKKSVQGNALTEVGVST